MTAKSHFEVSGISPEAEINGWYLIAHPAIGVASLTLVLASLFMVEAIFDIAIFFKVRSLHRSAWILFDGIVTLCLDY